LRKNLDTILDEELDEELGCSKYDYRNKDTDNSRNGHSSKTMHTSYGDMEEKILSMYAKGMTTGRPCPPISSTRRLSGGLFILQMP